jgi:hypothetical protein
LPAIWNWSCITKSFVYSWREPRLALTATDGDDDLQAVSGLEPGKGMLALGYDFTIALDGNPFTGQFKVQNQIGTAQRGGKLAGLAIDKELDHFYSGPGKARILSRTSTPSSHTRIRAIR